MFLSESYVKVLASVFQKIALFGNSVVANEVIFADSGPVSSMTGVLI
jgi:hypothetical protein